MTFKPIEPHEGRSHAGTTQDLDEGPKLVGMVFGPHHQQICRFDSHACGGRRIEQLSPVEHDEPSAFAAGFSGDHQGQALGAAPLFGSQPFDQAAAAKSAVGQEPIELGAAAGHYRCLADAPAVFEPGNLAAEVLNEFGRRRMAHVQAPQEAKVIVRVPAHLPVKRR